MKIYKFFLVVAILPTASCSLYPFGAEGKNGQYFGMSGSTQAMTNSSFVPKKIQRQEPIF